MGNYQKMNPIGMNILYTLSRLKPLKASISQVSSIYHLYLPPIIPWLPLFTPTQFPDCQPNWRHFASLTHRSAFSRNAYGPHFTSTAATLVGLWAKFGTVSCDVYRRSHGEGESDGRREADDWITDDWITSGLDEIWRNHMNLHVFESSDLILLLWELGTCSLTWEWRRIEQLFQAKTYR